MRFSYDDALRIGDILSRAAQAEIMPRFRRLADGQVRAKSSRFDVVTDADEAAERAIAAGLAAAFPAGLVIGEEAAAQDDSLERERIREAGAPCRTGTAPHRGSGIDAT